MTPGIKPSSGSTNVSPTQSPKRTPRNTHQINEAKIGAKTQLNDASLAPIPDHLAASRPEAEKLIRILQTINAESVHIQSYLYSSAESDISTLETSAPQVVSSSLKKVAASVKALGSSSTAEDVCGIVDKWKEIETAGSRLQMSEVMVGLSDLVQAIANCLGWDKPWAGSFSWPPTRQ
jgi:hypothetical protein